MSKKLKVFAGCKFSVVSIIQNMLCVEVSGYVESNPRKPFSCMPDLQPKLSYRSMVMVLIAKDVAMA